MNILNGVMVPHPPIILSEIGHGEEKKIGATTEAYKKAAEFIAASRPDTLVVISPHAEMYYDWFHISPGNTAKGDFSQFGAPEVRLNVKYDTEFVDALCGAVKSEDFPAGTAGEKKSALDHATMIPLYFLREAYKDTSLPPIVRIGLSGLPLIEHYRLGMLIRETADKLNRRVSVIGSGDLSHKLKEDGPYGFSSEGPQYDARIMDVMAKGAFGEFTNFDESFLDAAGECGHRSFTIMAGCFDGADVQAEKLSYEGPFGVGYGVCLFTPGNKNASRGFYGLAQAAETRKAAERAEKEDSYVRLARLSVETFVRTGRKAALPSLPKEMTNRRAGVFVSLHIRGQLRGCIGTISPMTDSVAEEILRNGISACSEDPRFSLVAVRELPLLEYSVDVLGEAEDISSPEELDVKRYGVIVTRGSRRGLLLPDLEGVDTVEKQIRIAKQKAGISADEAVKLQRFEVVRHV